MDDNIEIHRDESNEVVPLNTRILVQNFKLTYSILRRPDGSFDRGLAEFLDRKVPENVNLGNGVFAYDACIDRPTHLFIRVYQRAKGGEGLPSSSNKPVNSDIVPVIIYFHGGGFAHSSVNTAMYDTLCRRLAGLFEVIVISVDYRRAPEYRYPCAYEDGWNALKWVSSRTWLQSPKDSKVHVYLAGDDSGGNIAHNVALRAIGSGIEVLGNILIVPMFGGKERTESEKQLNGKYFVTVQGRDWYWKAFLPEGEDRDHPACNPFGPRATSIKGMNFPKTLLLVAGLDLTKDWQFAYAQGLKRAGHRVNVTYLERATVGFFLIPNNDDFHIMMEEIKSFVCST